MLLSTIILSSSVLYEMIGPVCARKALFLSGAIRTDEASGRPAVRESGAMKTANKKVPVKGNEKGNGKKEAAPKKEKAEEKPSPDLTGEKLDPKPHWAGTSGRLWADSQGKRRFQAICGLMGLSPEAADARLATSGTFDYRLTISAPKGISASRPA